MCRRKREFTAKDLAKLLEEAGLIAEQLLPGGPYATAAESSNTPTHLPLEYFDDSEYDVRTPQDWLALGTTSDGHVEPIPVRALLTANGAYAWSTASVVSYNDQTGTFGVVDTAGTPLSLPRIFVMFLAEDPEVFVRRVVAAYNLRRETEALLSYSLCVDCMPPDAGQAVDESVLHRMLSLASSNKHVSKYVILSFIILILRNIMFIISSVPYSGHNVVMLFDNHHNTHTM